MAYQYWRSVTIDATKVDSDLTDYPFLFNSTIAEFKTTANGGHIENTASGGASGSVTVPADLVFCTDKDDPNGTKLDFEVEKYDPATGELVAHVRIPSLSSTSDTTIYICYGDSSVTTSQENVTGVWDANFKGVWHLGDSLVDSSGGHDLTNYGSDNITGEIGDAQDFVRANSDYANDADYSETLTDATFELWLKSQPISAGHQRVFDVLGVNYNALHISDSDNAYGSIPANRLAFFDNTTDNSISIAWDSGWSDTWIQVTVACNGDSCTLYVNATSQASGTISSRHTTGTEARFGASINDVYYLDGSIDEVRISSVARSSGYISTTYNNQGSPSTFYSVGSEGTYIEPMGIASQEAFGSPILAGPITAEGIASAEAFGSPQLNQEIVPTGIAGAEAFGSSILAGPITAEGIASAEAFGTATIIQEQFIEPTGIASSEAFGTPFVGTLIAPTGIVSAEAFGTPILAGPIIAEGIASEEAFGTAQLNQEILPSGITSQEAFGTAQLAFQIRPTGIASAETFGVAELFELIPLKITVAGTDITAHVDLRSVRIFNVAGQADTARFYVKAGGGLGLAELQEVIITNPAGTERYFAGYISKLEERGEGPYLDYDVECVDYTFYLEHPEGLVSGEYGNQSDASVIADFMATCCPDLDATTYVEVVKSDVVYIKFDRETPKRALERLAEISGAEWYVDYGPGPSGKKAYLHYFAPGSNPAPFSLSDNPDFSSSFPYEELTEIKEPPKANKVIVVGRGDIVVTRTRGAETDYGWWLTAVHRDNNITTTAQAEAIGDQLLEEWAADPTYRCVVRRFGLRAGQDVTLVNAVRGINASFTIRQVITTLDGGGYIRHEVTMGKYLPGLGDIFSRSVREAEQFVLRDHGHSGEADGGPLGQAVVTTEAIADCAVDTQKLADLAVEAAKLADASVTATKIANAAVGSAAIATAAIGSAHIANGVILTAHIADAAITTAKIDDAAITSAKIDEAAIGTAHIQDLAVDSLKIAGEAVTAEKLAAGAVISEKLASGAVTTAKIANLAVTDAKIANLSADKIETGTIAATEDVTVDGSLLIYGDLHLYSSQAFFHYGLDCDGTATFHDVGFDSDGKWISTFTIDDNILPASANDYYCGNDTYYWYVVAAHAIHCDAIGNPWGSDVWINDHFRPLTNNQYDCGTSSYKWRNVYCVTLHQGDIEFEEKACAICGQPFKVGDHIVYRVIQVGAEGTRAVPVHAGCERRSK